MPGREGIVARGATRWKLADQSTSTSCIERVACAPGGAESGNGHRRARGSPGSISAGDWQDVVETVRIVRVPCRFGGARPFFICPGVSDEIACGRRVAELHGPGRYFLCRHCYHLANASQSESTSDRTMRRANKIRQRLGGDPGMAASFPTKPRGMWMRTYKRLRKQALDAEMRVGALSG